MELNSGLEQEIEVGRESSSAMAKEISARWISHVMVHLLWIEMVGQVKTTDRDPDGILRIDFEVLGKTRVQREEHWIAGCVGHANIALGGVHLKIGKPAASLDQWRDLKFMRESNHTPCQKPVGHICAQNSILIVADDWVWSGSKVTAEIVQIAPRFAVSVGEKHLPVGAQLQLSNKVELSVLRRARVF